MDLFALEYFTDPSKRVFWVYILSSILIAFIYLFFKKREKKVNLSKKLWLHPSAIIDYKYFFINYIIKILLIFPIVISAKEVTIFTFNILDDNFDYIDSDLSQTQIIVLYTITLFIISDFTRYWLHRFLHTVPFLWRFHKVHHSAKVLNPITFYRVHPVENLLFGFRYSFSIGITTGVFIFLFGAYIDIYTILGVNVLLFSFSLIGSNLRHSHINLGYFKFLENIFISPKQHQIHHSKKHFNKNYGGYLSIWDKLFKTIKYSNEVKTLKFGLRKEQMQDYDSVTKLLLVPFYK